MLHWKINHMCQADFKVNATFWSSSAKISYYHGIRGPIIVSV